MEFGSRGILRGGSTRETATPETTSVMPLLASVPSRNNRNEKGNVSHKQSRREDDPCSPNRHACVGRPHSSSDKANAIGFHVAHGYHHPFGLHLGVHLVNYPATISTWSRSFRLRGYCWIWKFDCKVLERWWRLTWEIWVARAPAKPINSKLRELERSSICSEHPPAYGAFRMW